MDANQRRQKLDLVWASIFLAAFAAWGLTMLVLLQAGSELAPIAIAMTLTLLLSVLAVPLLLLFPGGGRAVLLIGRVLVCLQLLSLAAALVMGIMLMARSV